MKREIPFKSIQILEPLRIGKRALIEVTDSCGNTMVLLTTPIEDYSIGYPNNELKIVTRHTIYTGDLVGSKQNEVMV